MTENTKIQWATHGIPATTLRAYKSAAVKTGCTVEEWLARRERGQKWCFRCRTWKETGAFSIDKTRLGGKSSSCKDCTSDASTASRYGLTLEGLRAFRLAHDNRCAICAATENVVTDHDHGTGKLRGLLCQNCNSAIGKFKESPTLLAAAIAYLEKHRG